MKQFDIKELFKQFVFGYIASGHTQTDSSEQELKRLIAEYVDDMSDYYCFSKNTLLDILDYVEHNISDDNKDFYNYYLTDNRYTNQLEIFLKYIITN